jgi:hypothetical protein
MSGAILEDVLSRDPRRIYEAAWAIIRLRAPEALDALAAALPEIRRETDGVELGGMAFPNHASLAFALRKLEHHRDSVGCLCGLYPHFILLDPQVEADAGAVRILDITYIQDKWVDHYTCECTHCASRYEVKEGESHYTWWEWRPAGPAPS